MISFDYEEKLNRFDSDEWKAMKKTVDLFGRIKSTDQAEMIATVLYSFDELNLCFLILKI